VVNGLAATVTPGSEGGAGGVVSGLAATVTPGSEGGAGGVVNGLAAIVTPGSEGGAGGVVNGLATAELAKATAAAATSKLRTFNELAVITCTP